MDFSKCGRRLKNCGSPNCVLYFQLQVYHPGVCVGVDTGHRVRPKADTAGRVRAHILQGQSSTRNCKDFAA